MEITEFITNFREQFDDPNGIELSPETKFRELDDWNSLTGLMTIAMADEEYGVTLTPNDLKSATTVQELYNAIMFKK